MRDPARIDRILEKLRRYWHANPDMRLGQIVWNAARDAWRVEGESPDVFDVEDEAVERHIPEVKP